MKMQHRLLWATFSGVLICLIGGICYPAFTQDTQLDAVRAAVFREILPRKGTAYLSFGSVSNRDSPFVRLCRFLHLPTNVAHQDIDPSDAFLQRFRGYQTVLKKASQTQRNPSGLVVDKQTGQPVTIYRIVDIRPLSNREYEVATISDSGSAVGGETCTYHVAREQGHWQIKGSFDCIMYCF